MVRFELGSQFLIEPDVHLQRFGVHRVHGFFSLNAFLLGFPFGEWAAGRIAQLVAGINESLNFGLSRTHSLFQALQVIDATVKLGRLSSDIKALMKQWKGAARLTAITATRQIFDSGDVSVPIKSWQLYVKTVDIDADSASVTLSVTNPLNNNIGRLYDPTEYTGLQYL
ncbi:TPA: hypothetical protein ACF6J0_001613 [Escherichia coli]